MTRFAFTILLFCLLPTSNILAQPDTDLFSYWQYYSDAPNVLYKSFVGIADGQLNQREKEIGTLKTADDWTKHQTEVRERLMEAVGAFPEKTPLNPHITGTINRGDMKVEKIVFQSRPGFYVTAALFLPKKRPKKAPAIIYCSGHTYLSFRSPVYQHVILNLVKKGFIVFAIDPVGQGERIEYSAEDAPYLNAQKSTSQHSYPGAQYFAAGNTLANIMIWDGIRAVDYLLTRKEVDPARIGITGRSGGGTQTAYIAAFDPRILAAVPENYITSYDALLKSRGPQDAEQNFFHGLAFGLDHADLIEVRAPRPMLISATTRDMFSIAGTRNTFQEAKQAYQALGKPENLTKTEDDAPHASTLKNREATYSFFMNELKMPGNPGDEDIAPFTNEELQVTRTGQVVTDYPDAKSVFDINKEQFLNSKKANNPSLDNSAIQQAVQKWCGFENQDAPVDPLFSGRDHWNGLVVERFLIKGVGGHPIPLVTVGAEDTAPGKLMLFLHPQGKKAAIKDSVLMKSLADQGYLVVLPDVSGIGELGPGYLKGDSNIDKVSYNQWFAGVLTGKSIVGKQMEDLASIVRFCQEKYPQAPVQLTAKSLLTPLAMHFTALMPSVKSLILIDPLVDYRSLVEQRIYDPAWVPAVVPGAMQDYDLPDLLVAISPRRVLVINPLNGNGKPLDEQAAQRSYASVTEAFAAQQNPGFFKLLIGPGDDVDKAIASW